LLQIGQQTADALTTLATANGQQASALEDGNATQREQATTIRLMQEERLGRASTPPARSGRASAPRARSVPPEPVQEAISTTPARRSRSASRAPTPRPARPARLTGENLSCPPGTEGTYNNGWFAPGEGGARIRVSKSDVEFLDV